MDPVSIASLVSAATGVLGATRPAQPQMPTSVSPIFGSGLFAADSSGWLVNFGDAAKVDQTTAAKTGPSLTATPISTGQGGYTSPIPPNIPGGYAPGGGGQQVSGSLSAAIPTTYLFIAGGALVLIILLRKRG